MQRAALEWLTPLSMNLRELRVQRVMKSLKHDSNIHRHYNLVKKTSFDGKIDNDIRKEIH